MPCSLPTITATNDAATNDAATTDAATTNTARRRLTVYYYTNNEAPGPSQCQGRLMSAGNRPILSIIPATDKDAAISKSHIHRNNPGNGRTGDTSDPWQSAVRNGRTGDIGESL